MNEEEIKYVKEHIQKAEKDMEYHKEKILQLQIKIQVFKKMLQI